MLAHLLSASEQSWAPGLVTGVASSGTFAGLALYVIGRLWKSLDSEREARAREGERTRERDLAAQERMITALLEAAEVARLSAEQSRLTTQQAARMEALLQ